MILRHMKQRAIVWVGMMLSMLFASTPILSQDIEACLRVITQSLAETAVNCANNTTGMVCYGSGMLTSVLDPSVDKATFDELGERISVTEVVSLSLSAFNAIELSWGTTVINLQANLPTSFKQDAVIVAFGGTDVENTVDSVNAFKPLDTPITVKAIQNSELRTVTLSDPGDADVNGEVASGTMLTADAMSEDEQWIRVVFNDTSSWISRSSLEGEFEGLPMYGPNNLTSFQAFDITSNVTSSVGSTCEQAPSLVLVQGPSDIPVDIIVNGLPIRIASTILLRTLDSGCQLEITTLYGMATINADTTNPIFVTPGFPILVTLGDQETTLARNSSVQCPSVRSFGLATLITQDQINIFSFIERIPSNLLNYSVSVPRLIVPSGVGQVIRRLIFRNQNALEITRRLCAENILSDEICTILGL